jgi:hypothetical protein
MMNGAEAPEIRLRVLRRALKYFSGVGCQRPSFGSFGRNTPVADICLPRCARSSLRQSDRQARLWSEGTQTNPLPGRRANNFGETPTGTGNMGAQPS